MRKNRFAGAKIAYRIVAVIIIILILDQPRPSLAQQSNGTWVTPINLSRSGGTNSPLMVADATGILHVIWRDNLIEDIVYYTSGNERHWQPIRQVVFPFGASLPRLIPAPNGIIHAFWIRNEQSQTNLYYSQVDSLKFDDPLAWATPQLLNTSAVAFDATLDSQDTLHTVYTLAGSSEHPAGVYYQNGNNGKQWSEPIPLFQSQYFRALSPENSHISIAATLNGSNSTIYAVWDNRLRKRVSFTASKNGGINWTSPIDIDVPNDKEVNASPFNINVQAQKDQVVLAWQFGNPAASCNIYSQWSSNKGDDWSARKLVMAGERTCAQIHQLLDIENGILLLASLKSQAYFLAWNGMQWTASNSNPLPFPFPDPETFDMVQMDRLKAIYMSPKRIWVIGSDTSSGGDVWATYQDILPLDEWFTSPTTWQDSELITTVNAEINQILLVSDQNDTFHAFWSQVETIESNSNATPESQSPSATIPLKVIYHTRWQGKYWSQPIPILRTPNGHANQPIVKLDSNGRLFAFWSGGDNGEIFFSWANAQESDNPLEWEVVQTVPNTALSGINFDILIDETNVIYVIYAIPLNEDRGVFLTRSTDDGKNWLKPVKIFNGAEAGWDMVSVPSLSSTSDGRLLAQWLRYTPPTGRGPLGIYFASSMDGGATWSKTEELLDKAITWEHILGQGEPIVHSFMLETADNYTSVGTSTLWHAVFDESSHSWGRLSSLWSIRGAHIPLALIMDSAGQIHLFQITTENNKFTLQYWYWDGARWLTNENASLYHDNIDEIVTSMSAAITSKGELGVVYVSSISAAAGQTTQSYVRFTQRSINIPAVKPTRQPITIPTIATAKTVTETPLPQPTPTSLNLQTVNVGNPGNSSNNLIMSVGLGSVLAIIMVVGGIFITKLRNR